MDPLAPRLPPDTYETRSVAEGGTQPNENCCKGLRIRVSRIVQSVQSFFASRINGPAQNPSSGPELRLSRPDEAEPAASASQSTLSQYEQDVKDYKADALAIVNKKKAIAIQEAIKQCPELEKIPPLEGEAPVQEIKIPASAAPTYAVQYEQDKKEKIALAIDLFIKKLAIVIQAAGDQAISALKLSFQERKEMPHLKGETPFLKVKMPLRKMIKDARKIFDDFQNRFPEDVMKYKQKTDIAQRLWMTLHSMHFMNEGDTVHPPQFEKIMQDARNYIPELLLLNIAGTQPENVSREQINRLYRACFQAARNEALAAIREQNPAILRRLNDDQFKTATENYESDFFKEFDRLSSPANDKEYFVPAVLAQAHENVKIRVESGNKQSLRKIDEMLAASITPTMLLAKMSSAAAVALALAPPRVTPIDTGPAAALAPSRITSTDIGSSTSKSPQRSNFHKRFR
ncbi:MAG: hypothetical protein JWQ10_3138 [Herbaspirillum sp.]|nr:hypothetical protein [Herbaspirillum sp.]